MAQMLNELTDKQFEEMYQAARNKGYTDKEFFDIMLKNGYVTQDDYNTLDFDEQGNATQKAVEETPATDILETPEDNTEGWGYKRTNLEDDASNGEVGQQILKTAGSVVANSEGKIGNRGSLGIKPLLTNIGTKVLGNSPAMNSLLNLCAKNADKMFSISKDPELVKDLMYNQGDNIANKVSAETKKKVIGKFLGTLAQGLYTDAVMIKSGMDEDRSGLQKDSTWAAALNALDSATETLPILSWIDLGADLLLSGKQDENGEGYSKGGLLSKINYAVNNLAGNDSARTIWENDPEKQAEVKAGNDWMEEQGFTRGDLFSPSKPGAKAGSKADVMLKNEKAIDTIQGNTAGRGEAATDGVSADREQQNKRDANLYISWKNRADGKNLDAKNAYTYKDFTKDFKAQPDGTWVNKKTGETANSMWTKEKKRAEDNGFKVK